MKNPETGTQVAEAARSHAHASAKELGSIVWSDVYVGSKPLDRRAIRDALVRHGLPDAIQPESRSAAFAFGRAVSAWKTTSPRRFAIVREEKRSDTCLLVREEGKGLDYRAAAVATLVSSEGSADGFEFVLHAGLTDDEEKAAKADLATFAGVVWRYRHGVDAAEFQQTIRSALVTFFNGTRIRRTGSVYWLDASARKLVAKLEAVVRDMGSALVTIPVLDSLDARRGVQQPLAGAFERELSALVRELRDLSAGEADVRVSTWTSRRERLASVRGRVDVAQAVLAERSTALTDLMSKIDQALVFAIASETKEIDALEIPDTFDQASEDEAS